MKYTETPFEILSVEQMRFLSALQQNQVEVIVVGGYAVRVHGHLRFAPDLDLVIQTRTENLERLQNALAALGISKSRAVAEHFASKANPKVPVDLYYVDLLGAVECLKFDDIEPGSLAVRHGEFCLKIISKEDLIEVKRQTLSRGGRGSKADQDREDIRVLSGLTVERPG
jgi:hypothetical protein